MKTKVIKLYLAVGIITTSCVDPIPLEPGNMDGELVFYGVYTQLDESHYFSISRTTDFGNPVPPVTGAQVVIFDSQGNSAQYAEKDSGIYQLEAGVFPGLPGRKYHVEITLANGLSFLSSPQTLSLPVEVDSIYFLVENEQVLGGSNILVDQTNINIYIDTPLSSHSNGAFGGLRWQVEEAYSFSDLPCHPFFDPSLTCYFRIPNNESDVKLYGIEGDQQYLSRYPVHSRILAPDDQFVERHYFSIYQFALSPEAFDYWNKVKIVANQSGDLLDTPPAAVPGNIYQQNDPNSTALGYFEVSGKTVGRIYTLPHLIGGNLVIETCPDSRDFIIQDKCCFCYLLDQPENRITRPEYWND